MTNGNPNAIIIVIIIGVTMSCLIAYDPVAKYLGL